MVKESPAQEQAGHVLFVDDDLQLLRAFERLLRRTGFTVTAVPSGDEALEALSASDAYDVVVSDVTMPGISGTELLSKARTLGYELPFVLLTGDPSIDSAIAAVEHGAFKYLQKPVDVETLSQTLRRAAGLGRIAKLKRAAAALQDEAAEDPEESLSRFRSGLAKLWLATQPIVSLLGDRTIAFELLLRTEEPSIPHPGAFLDLAKALGKQDALGRAVRARAAKLASNLDEEVMLFVNVLPRDLLDSELYDPDAPLTRHARRIVLEVTERAPLDAVEDLEDRVTELRRLGYRVAVDDLGAGYAGLSSLARLDPEVAKIDMTLVRAIDRDPRREAIVGGIVATCRRLGLLVVAEGVETPQERDRLRGIGCELMQGYLFGRPATAPLCAGPTLAAGSP